MKYKDYGRAILDAGVARFFAERMLRRLAKARQGDSASESCLVDRLCSVRASAAHLHDLPEALKEIVKETVSFLKSASTSGLMCRSRRPFEPGPHSPFTVSRRLSMNSARLSFASNHMKRGPQQASSTGGNEAEPCDGANSPSAVRSTSAAIRGVSVRSTVVVGLSLILIR